MLMRNANLKIISSSLTVESPSIASACDQKVSDFIQNRFYALGASHHSVLITGSSLAYQHRDIKNEQVLDSGAMTFVKNKTGIVTGVRQATADGLGGSPDDDMENASIANVASFACETFIDSNASAANIYHHIAESSEEHALSFNLHQAYDSQCALAAAVFSYTGKGKYQGELSNMGDTFLVVLSPDLKIKKMLPARHIYRGMGVWTPASVQMLEQENLNDVFINNAYEAEEGDVIISMTDGIWSELDLKPFSQKNNVREFYVDDQSFENLLRSAALPRHCSAYELAETVLTKAIETSLYKRNQLLNLLSELKKIALPSKKATVDDVLMILKHNGQDKTAKALSELLFNNSGDGIVYLRDVAIPFALVLQDLESRTAGDCSTINVTRLPYHTDECIRALLEYPNRAGMILHELLRELSSPDQIKESIARLKQETVLVKSRILLEALKTEKNISDSLLDSMEQVLVSIYQIKTILKNTPLYINQLQQISHLMAPLQQPVKGCVFKLIKEDVTPGFTLFSIFATKKTKAFKHFIKAQGPGMTLTQFLQEPHDRSEIDAPMTL